MIDWIILDSWGQNGDKATPLLDNLELENLKKRLSPVSISYTYLKKAFFPSISYTLLQIVTFNV